MKESVILPQELIIEILLRLPVKSLVRFKCVSKSWLSLISDPQFLQSQRLLVLAQRASKVNVRSVDVNASLQDDSVPSVMKLKFPLPNHVTIIDSCRGFVAFESYPDFYIWNPCTGFHKQLPPSPCYGRSLGVRASGWSYVRVCKILFGFGYDSLTNDYLIIVACCHGKRMDHVDIRAHIFSLRANSWKEMEADGWNRAAASITAKAPYGFKAGLNFSGAIHWLATRPSPGFIAAFDLTEKVFSEIALPNDFHSRGDDHVQLRVLGGFLCLCVDRADQNIGGEIWVMREYKVQSSWTKSHVVVPPHDNCHRHFSPMCFTKSGHIVGIDSRAKLVKFNDKGDVLEHRNCFCDHPLKCCYSDRREECSAVFLKERSAVMLTESLLSLPCDRMNTGG